MIHPTYRTSRKLALSASEIFIDLVGRIGVELNDNIALLVGGLILALIVSIYLGLPQKVLNTW